MRVRNDYVAIRKEKVENVLPSGLYTGVPDGQEDANKATIVAVGPDVEDLSPGEVVYVSQYTGTRVEFPDESGLGEDNIFFMKEEDVLAVLE